MKTIIVTILGFFLLNITLHAQCNEHLVEIAMAQSGADAIFVREFKVKLQKGTVKTPIPTGKYNVYLKENTLYRFNISSDKSIGGEAILQLFDKDKCVGSTNDEIGGKTQTAFDYIAPRTGNYQVVVSFKEGKPGCAAGIMSMVVHPSIADSLNNSKQQEMEILYLNVDNPVSIMTDKNRNDTIIFELDNGEIKGLESNYILRPQREGLASLRVIIKNEDGKIKEEARSDFLVRRLPSPGGSIQGLQGGLISRSTLQIANALNIDQPVDYEQYGFEVIDFIVIIGEKGEKRYINSGKEFNPSLKNLFANISEETRLVIESIHVRTPDKQVITIEPLGFIVR